MNWICFGKMCRYIHRLALAALVLTGTEHTLHAADYYVAANGNDGNAGTEGQPFRTIIHSAQVARAGDVVHVNPGTYENTYGGIQPAHSGTRDNPVVFESTERLGAVISGSGFHSAFYCGDNGNGISYITIRGFRFSDVSRAVMPGREGWRIEDCLIENAEGPGIIFWVPDSPTDPSPYTDIVILRCVFQDIQENCFAGCMGMGNLHMKNCIARRGNRAKYPPGGAVGACKLLCTDGVVVENLVSYDHCGCGWWFDWENVNFTIRGCTIFGNHGLDKGWDGPGIRVEI
ncbi:MAG: DUF1565 domain-containing protein, partial [Chitinivibrionales bacterium]|nr:DUF1565 domain-containing protein [Chitinivibrionales bacterium]MBD3395071.1 DUF1565 domain-containing protein [Chitinivibrionales bacterium]